MDHHDIEIFLTIVHAQNISSAADALFLAPTTVGARLKALENELGFSLFHRQKGHKTVQLTEKGTLFIPYAENWIKIWNQTSMLRDSHIPVQFSFASSSTLLDFSTKYYKKFIQLHPELQFKISTLDSEVAYSLVQHGEVDIGFVMYASHVNDVITSELFKEPLVLAYASSYSINMNTQVSIHQFPLKHQIHFLWDPIFDKWYHSHMPSYEGQVIKVNSMSLMKLLFNPKESWSIVPLSVAQNLYESGLAKYAFIKEQPPSRSVYLIINKLKQSQPLIREFCDFIEKDRPTFPAEL